MKFATYIYFFCLRHNYHHLVMFSEFLPQLKETTDNIYWSAGRIILNAILDLNKEQYLDTTPNKLDIKLTSQRDLVLLVSVSITTSCPGVRPPIPLPLPPAFFWQLTRNMILIATISIAVEKVTCFMWAFLTLYQWFLYALLVW